MTSKQQAADLVLEAKESKGLTWEEIAAGRLIRLLPGWSPPPIALHVVTPPGRHRAPSVSALIAFFERTLTAAPWASVSAP